MTEKENKVLKVAKALILVEGDTTTLDVKKACRVLWTNEEWKQKFISNTLAKSDFDYNDNGSYRTYFSTLSETDHLSFIYERKLSKTKLANRLVNSGTDGEKVTVCWIVKDGTERCYTGWVLNAGNLSNLGYIKFKTVEDNIKQIDPRKLQSITVNNTKYTRK